MATVRSKEDTKRETERLKLEIEKKHGKSVEQIRAEREKRMKDAMELRQPDRVPVTVGTGVFAARGAGKRLPRSLETIPGVVPEVESGTVLDILDLKNYRWPGGPLPADAPYQFVESDYMKPEEYDLFLNDPSDFVIRQYYPRINGILAPLTKLPPIGALREAGFVGFVGFFARPEFQQMAALVQKAAKEQEIVMKEAADFSEEMAQLGFSRQ